VGVPANKALQQTGHANNGFSRRNVSSRVSRLLSLVFNRKRPADHVLDR
jgi:hypothetical protein